MRIVKYGEGGGKTRAWGARYGEDGHGSPHGRRGRKRLRVHAGLDSEASRVEAGCGNLAKPQLQQCNWSANNWHFNRTIAGARAASAGESE